MSEHGGPTVPTVTRRKDAYFRPDQPGLTSATSTPDGTVKLSPGPVPVVTPKPVAVLTLRPGRHAARASHGDCLPGAQPGQRVRAGRHGELVYRVKTIRALSDLGVQLIS
jgi:hypothetical protein